MMTAKFADDPLVSFGDVDWSEEQFSRAFGVNQNVGDGGWPTIRYFNRGTGYGGKPYKKKTDDELCVELGDNENLQQYIQEKSGSSFCDVVWGTDCSDMELKYIDTWIGHEVRRSKDAMSKEQVKFRQDLLAGRGSFAQNQQRVMVLTHLLARFEHPEL
mmetsp:Transcript_41747/g.135003  ORF Transcript_41747/g.135003 Transcript_41747/m.135003 type:complete len:159 (+) Transcript_41747:323-799(+)